MPGLLKTTHKFSAPFYPHDVSIEDEFLYNLHYLENEAKPYEPVPLAYNGKRHQASSFSPTSVTNSATSSIIVEPTICTRERSFAFPTRPQHESIVASVLRSPTFSAPYSIVYQEPPKPSNRALLRGASITSFDQISTSSFKNMQTGMESCYQCEKRVYPLDRLSTGDNRVYHKSCFRCKECNRVLAATNFAKLDDIIFCKPHYIEKFRLRGKYEAVQSKPGSRKESVASIPTTTPRVDEVN